MNEHFDPSRRHWLAQVAGLTVAAAAMQLPLPAWAIALKDGERRRHAPLNWVPALQLYSLGLKDDADLGGVFTTLAGIGYREVEFAGNYGKPAAEIRRLLDTARLTAPSTHVAPTAAGGAWHLDDIPRLAGELDTLGAHYAVMGGAYYPGMPDDGPPDADGWKRAADFFNEKGSALRKHGIRLAFHNHATEFRPLPGDTNGYRLLAEHSDPKALDFQLDIGWAVAARQDIPTLFDLLGDRLKLLHIKDTNRADTTGHIGSADVGTGLVNWNEVMELMRDSCVKHAFVEQEPPFPTTPMDAMSNNYRFLTRLFGGQSA